MDLFLILFLIIAVSMDGFFVGMALGVSRVQLLVWALLLISFTSFLVIFPVLYLGDLISSYLGAATGSWIGGLILIFMGIVFWYKERGNNNRKRNAPPIRIHFPPEEEDPFSKLDKILKTPEIEKPGLLTPAEAILLGVALAIDAFGAGLGASFTGKYPVFITAFGVGLGKFLFVWGGYLTGRFFKKNFSGDFWKVLPGIFLIILGLLTIWG